MDCLETDGRLDLTEDCSLPTPVKSIRTGRDLGTFLEPIVVKSILLAVKGWVLCLLYRYSDNNEWQVKWSFFLKKIYLQS